jgi:ABC-type polysaccharide/polyol phosphate transport system ATPase subunit
MTESAVSVDQVWKHFRLYHEKNQYLKTTVLKGTRARYDEFWALKDLSFEIPTGSTFGIIGSNGSGKSTLLKCLTGILTPEKGSIAVNGRIAALLELGAGFHPDLSGRENIFLNGAILGMTSKDIHRNLDNIVEFAGLGEFIDTPVKNYSSGMTVRLGFAIAINVDPEILIIDEVLAVGDTAFQQKCFEKIEEFRTDGRTIILVSHGLPIVAQICDTVVWIEKGVLQEVGPAQEVVGNYYAASHDALPVDDNEIGQRWGSGEVSISKIKLLNQDGVAQRVFQTGERLAISIDYTSQIAIPSANVSVGITHLHGTGIWGTSTEKNSIKVPVAIGPNSLRLELASLPLLNGTYDLTIAITDQSGVHEFDHWEKRVRFDVNQGDIYDIGLIDISSSWTINS